MHGMSLSQGNNSMMNPATALRGLIPEVNKQVIGFEIEGLNLHVSLDESHVPR